MADSLSGVLKKDKNPLNQHKKDKWIKLLNFLVISRSRIKRSDLVGVAEQRLKPKKSSVQNQQQVFSAHQIESLNVKYGPYHSDGCRGAVKLPVEGQPCQLTLQLHTDVAGLLARQRNLGLAIWSLVMSWQPRVNHLTQVGEERFDGGSQTSVQLLGGRKQDLFMKKNGTELLILFTDLFN